MKVVAILGTYRKGGVTDRVVDEIIAAAEGAGGSGKKVYLKDMTIEFCRNCRTCTQEPGRQRGRCVIDDGMSSLLDEIEGAGRIILSSPMNVGTATALTKRFIERLIPYAYWPWGTAGPRPRRKEKDKKAVIVVSSAAPSLIARLAGGNERILRKAASYLGARCVGVLSVGLAAGRQEAVLSEAVKRKARRLGRELVLPS